MAASVDGAVKRDWANGGGSATVIVCVDPPGACEYVRQSDQLCGRLHLPEAIARRVCVGAPWSWDHSRTDENVVGPPRSPHALLRSPGADRFGCAALRWIGLLPTHAAWYSTPLLTRSRPGGCQGPLSSSGVALDRLHIGHVLLADDASAVLLPLGSRSHLAPLSSSLTLLGSPALPEALQSLDPGQNQECVDRGALPVEYFCADRDNQAQCADLRADDSARSSVLHTCRR